MLVSGKRHGGEEIIIDDIQFSGARVPSDYCLRLGVPVQTDLPGIANKTYLWLSPWLIQLALRQPHTFTRHHLDAMRRISENIFHTSNFNQDSPAPVSPSLTLSTSDACNTILASSSQTNQENISFTNLPPSSSLLRHLCTTEPSQTIPPLSNLQPTATAQLHNSDYVSTDSSVLFSSLHPNFGLQTSLLDTGGSRIGPRLEFYSELLHHNPDSTSADNATNIASPYSSINTGNQHDLLSQL
ncbi:unnamed protein product, partial [Protopolystoma xenopodis]